MKNLNDLRSILFEEIENVKNNASSEALARAGTVNSLAGSLISIAKAEIEFTKTTGAIVDDGLIKARLANSQQPRLNTLPYGEKAGRKW